MLVIKFLIVIQCYLIGATTANYLKEPLPNSDNRSSQPILERHSESCDELLEPELVARIASYQPIADQIIDFIVNKEFKGETFRELENFADFHPIRKSGFENLENAIDYMIDRMKTLGLENVHGEQVPVPKWFRGEESAELLTPYKRNIPILGLGTSVGTPEGGITAPILAVQSYDELDQKKDQVSSLKLDARGKIVVYNQGWNNYYDSNVYKHNGASYASQYGAVATLIQSITPFSLTTLHTGIQTYWNNVTQIPTATITMEDAELLYRLQAKGAQMEMHLVMNDYNLPMTTSRNVVGEIIGVLTPTEYVGVSGHIDNLDVGQGAMDDAGGVMISVMALAALKKLERSPNRTLQAILWTSHEAGLWGAQGFVQQHKNDLQNYSVVLESDSGTFLPKGLNFAGSDKAGCVIKEILKLMKGINATEYEKVDAAAADISLLQVEGVPGLSPSNENDKYFWYHHSTADTMTMVDSNEVDICTALWAVTAYVLADIPAMLPRDELQK